LNRESLYMILLLMRLAELLEREAKVPYNRRPSLHESAPRLVVD